MTRRSRIKEIIKYIRASILVLVISAVIEIIAGSILGELFSHSYFPGILILIPPMMELRGNISSAFAAKLSTALHLGTVKPQIRKNTKKFKNDFYASIITLTIMPIILGFIVWIFCLIFNIPNIGLLFFILISFLTGLISGLIMSVISIIISILTFKYGLNPDALVVPILGFTGDILTVITLFYVINLLEVINLGVII
ncbi:MAG: magnesium transporter [Candidatus Helarchaeota archaeon]